MVPPTMLRCSPVAVCLFLSASIPAADELAGLTDSASLCISAAAACRTGKAACLCVSVMFLLLSLGCMSLPG